MKVMIVDEKHGGPRSLVLGGWARLTLTICPLGLPAVLGYLGHQAAAAAARSVELYADKASPTVVDRQSPGLVAQANHGNRYETRYAYDREALLKSGDIVKK